MCSHASSVLLAITWLASLLTSRDRKVTKTVVKYMPVTFAVCLFFFGWVLSFYSSLDYFIRFNLWVSAKDYIFPVTSNWLADRVGALTQSNGSVLLIMSALGAFLILKRKLPADDTSLVGCSIPCLLSDLGAGRWKILHLSDSSRRTDGCRCNRRDRRKTRQGPNRL